MAQNTQVLKRGNSSKRRYVATTHVESGERENMSSTMPQSPTVPLLQPLNRFPRSCTASEDCISSSDYPANYPDDDHCIIQVSHNPRRFMAISVVSFSTEWDWDFLVINGIRYSGVEGPHKIIPRGTITWTSDAQLHSFAELDVRKYSPGAIFIRFLFNIGVRIYWVSIWGHNERSKKSSCSKAEFVSAPMKTTESCIALC